MGHSNSWWWLRGLGTKGSAFLVCASFACWLAACRSVPSDGAGVSWQECRIEGFGRAARCATVRVPENRSVAGGRTLALRVAKLPSLALSPAEDPLVILVGGPGQAATRSGGMVAQALAQVGRLRDVLLVDQRGTGDSNGLRCTPDPDPLGSALSDRFALAEVSACLESLDADTRHYWTGPALQDLEAIRETLGYERLSLWGGSYGTRVAIEYAERYPERVRALVLDGAAPVSVKLPLYVARDAQRALERLISDCQAEPNCRESFPSLDAEVQALLLSLEGNEQNVSLPHPRTFEQRDFRLARDGVAAAIRLLLYSPELSASLPMVISSARRGDWRSFVAHVATITETVDSDLAQGLFLSVVCAEDISQIESSDEDVSRVGFLRGGGVERLREMCKLWPSGEPPHEYFEPRTISAPTLVLSGELDPIVPPSWGHEVMKQLEHGQHVVVSGAAHGVTTLGCMPRLVAEFYEKMEKVDAECMHGRKRPAFVTGLFGAGP